MADKFRTLTVKALRELLEDEDDDALVAFVSDYGDYHHTQQAHGLRGEVEEGSLYPSAYSHSGFALVDDSEEEEEEGKGVRVLVLR